MERYSRQQMIIGWDQQLLAEANVLVVGAGTTGNEVIKNLALLGFGRITIVDSDCVETVNLSRSVLFRPEDIGHPKASTAARRAKDLNDMVETVGWDRDVIHGVGSLEYGSFDAALLTVDNLEARLWVNRYCWLNGTPLIDTGVHGLLGNVFLMVPPNSPCLECAWTPLAYQRLAQKYSCLKVGLSPEDPKVPMVITTAAVVGAIAAQECVRLLHDQAAESEPRAGVHSAFDGESGSLFGWKGDKRPECPGHNWEIDRITVLDIDLSTENSVEFARTQVAKAASANAVELFNDKELVYGQVCNVCGREEPIAPVMLGTFSRRECPACGCYETVPKDRSEELRDGFTLGQLSVPANHLIRAVADQHGHIGEFWLRVS